MTDPVLLDHLERRRSDYNQAMWQAPALTIAGQAFLLQVITNEDIEWWARSLVLLAGLAGVLAALLSLLQLHKREVEYSERIKEVGGFDPTPAEPATLPVVKWWELALALFVPADVVAFLATV